VVDRKVKVPSFVISTELEDSVVVVNLNTKRYYILNGTAGFIWRGITQGNCESQIVDQMALEYDATKERITASVHRLFDELERAELVV
jgi:Coenzyme PQQ synthesis protein D (PqqD)